MNSQDSLSDIVSLIKDKEILFITTKNMDYIRISQECKMLKQYAEKYDVIGSMSKSYPIRILHVWFSLFFKSLKKYDMIFVGFMPQLIVPLFKIKFRNKKIIIDFFISIYDTLVDDRKKVKDKSICAKVLKKIDCTTLNAAEYVIADTKAHGTYFIKQLGMEINKLKVLYLEADTTCYHPMCTKKPENLEGKFVVLFFGSILPVQGVDIIMHAISILNKENDIHFVIIGPMKVNKVVSNNVTYIEWLSQQELATYISFADICLAGHFSDIVGKANRTIPGKVYIYLAMNKKIILGESDANRELFDDTKRNDIVYVKRGDACALSYTILIEKEKKENV